MDTLEALHTRRSIRAYRGEPLPRSLIEDVIWDATQVPTPPASGEAPWAFCVIEGVARIAAYGARAKQHARENPRPGRRPPAWSERPDFKVFWDAPALVLICAQRGNVEAPTDCCRAGQNFMLSAHARGLGSCWVGAPLQWLASAGVATELGLPAGYDPCVALILGYAQGDPPPGQPRPRPTVHWCG